MLLEKWRQLRLAVCGVATNLQFVTHAASEECGKVKCSQMRCGYNPLTFRGEPVAPLYPHICKLTTSLAFKDHSVILLD